MWAKIGQWAVNALILPLLTSIGNMIVSYIKEEIRRKRVSKENKEKVKVYVQATTDIDISDAFDDLP